MERDLKRFERGVEVQRRQAGQKRPEAESKKGGLQASAAADEPEPEWDLDDEQWDEVFEIEERGRPRPKRDLHAKKKAKPEEKKEPDEKTGAREKGVVMTTRKQRCRVVRGEELVTCWLPAEMAASQKSSVAVGDEIVFERRGNDCVVSQVLPRRTVLSRPDPFHAGTERVVAANVDVVVQVSAGKNPPLRPGLIDRYLIAVERGGARPVICINKADLLDDEERAIVEETVAPWRALGIAVVFCSAKSGEGIDELRKTFEGRTAVLVGHSGVGKSSLLNELDQSLQIATRDLHKEGKVGRHTTTSSTLYEFADGTRLIDTPGIREFGLWDIDADALRFYFPEFEPYALDCRYRNCTHSHEPECAVEAAAEEGLLPAERYERYLRMLEELKV